jgi:hypothetical protein
MLPAAVRARIELLRERAGAPDGLEVTCGGVSMLPAIARGARVRVRRDRQRIRAGAVAAFVTRDGTLELHRLVARGPAGWWAHLGDNQASPDVGLVHETQLIGVTDVAVRQTGPVVRARALLRFTRAAIRRNGAARRR